MKATFTPRCGGVYAIQEQHVKVNIEIQRTTESLEQRLFQPMTLIRRAE
jgi:hypothetical protein